MNLPVSSLLVNDRLGVIALSIALIVAALASVLLHLVVVRVNRSSDAKNVLFGAFVALAVCVGSVSMIAHSRAAAQDDRDLAVAIVRTWGTHNHVKISKTAAARIVDEANKPQPSTVIFKANGVDHAATLDTDIARLSVW